MAHLLGARSPRVPRGQVHPHGGRPSFPASCSRIIGCLERGFASGILFPAFIGLYLILLFYQWSMLK